jgi:lipopolysaccharide/colanic/teichoic acid biosynthesis glycosyltransferase
MDAMLRSRRWRWLPRSARPPPVAGPRPPLASEVEAYEEWQLDRLEVRPGITGLWQVSGRSELSFDQYVRLDLFYIENWSLAYDLFILAKTIPMLLAARGAY